MGGTSIGASGITGNGLVSSESEEGSVGGEAGGGGIEGGSD